MRYAASLGAEFEAKRCEGKVKKGGILLSVHCDSSDWTSRAKKVLEQTGANDISSTGEAGADFNKSDRPVPKATSPVLTFERATACLNYEEQDIMRSQEFSCASLLNDLAEFTLIDMAHRIRANSLAEIWEFRRSMHRPLDYDLPAYLKWIKIVQYCRTAIKTAARVG